MKNKQNIFDRKKTKILALLSIVLILSCTVGVTLALIYTKTDSLENQFVKAYVTCKVDQNGNAIRVQNTGNVDAYIRASYTVNWADGSGNVLGTAPQRSDYNISLNTDDWTESGGFYYHKERVTPSAYTQNLVNNVVVSAEPPVAGYSLHVEVAAEAIQADGTENGTAAYKDAWVSAPSLMS